MEELIAKRYVNALVSVANEEQKVAYSEALNALASVFDDAALAERLSSPLISLADKTSFVVDGLGEGADTNLQNFIKVMGEHNRLDLLPNVARILNQMLQAERNEYEGTVLASNALDAAEIENLENSLKTYTGSTIKLTQAQSDVDGVKVTVEDLGIEVNFSKQRVKEQLIDFITKSL
ncbi:MAG TPA: F0F1 ATP synthase subunit delta [Campylobacterales bacterium]|nr:F0F1 ATP synthase subunit delta [Campylobacterales bacterium]